jgi:hypothetical protein
LSDPGSILSGLVDKGRDRFKGDFDPALAEDVAIETLPFLDIAYCPAYSEPVQAQHLSPLSQLVSF